MTYLVGITTKAESTIDVVRYLVLYLDQNRVGYFAPL
ncbi:uncharacterized protein G2W53_044129 [Senna tora]|uniref:Uncharacterized protein n=1 Tax=Senna tora TaxID=362788 RepID=A0A834SLT7_9FABA|nr:uncharacterized protein G2W53_044129 [Senna tora]